MKLARVDKVDGHKRLRLRQWQKNFIAALKLSPNVTLACQAANISREMAYRTRRDNPAFAEQWSEAQESAVDELETKAFELALRDNVPLLQFLLKAHRRHIYGDVSRHEHALLGKVVFVLPEKEDREP